MELAQVEKINERDDNRSAMVRVPGYSCRKKEIQMLWRNIPALAFGVAVLAGSAAPAHAQWAKCGGEKDDCVMSSGAHNLVRYGKDSSWFYLEVQGMTKVPCNNAV